MHGPSGYALGLISSFDSKENKDNLYRGEDCMEKFCKDLRNQAMKIINYEKKEMIPLTDNEIGFAKGKKFVIYVKNNFVLMKMIRVKLEIIVITLKNLEELLIIFVI